MLFFDKESVADGETATSFARYIGGNNLNVPGLVSNPALNVAVTGASSTAIVTLEVAVVATDAAQSTSPVNGDFFTVTENDGTPIEFTKNTTAQFPSLNGLWVRFKVDNTAGLSPAIITAQIS